MGIARQLLEALIELAVSEGISQLSLETGSGEGFEPALEAYQAQRDKYNEQYTEMQQTKEPLPSRQPTGCQWRRLRNSSAIMTTR